MLPYNQNFKTSFRNTSILIRSYTQNRGQRLYIDGSTAVSSFSRPVTLSLISKHMLSLSFVGSWKLRMTIPPLRDTPVRRTAAILLQILPTAGSAFTESQIQRVVLADAAAGNPEPRQSLGLATIRSKALLLLSLLLVIRQVRPSKFVLCSLC